MRPRRLKNKPHHFSGNFQKLDEDYFDTKITPALADAKRVGTLQEYPKARDNYVGRFSPIEDKDLEKAWIRAIPEFYRHSVPKKPNETPNR
jgi:hypothetical protein